MVNGKNNYNDYSLLGILTYTINFLLCIIQLQKCKNQYYYQKFKLVQLISTLHNSIANF